MLYAIAITIWNFFCFCYPQVTPVRVWSVNFVEWTSTQTVRTRHSNASQNPGCSGVNFINILKVAFVYKIVLRIFYAHTVWVCNFLAKGNRLKSCSLNVGEIDCRRQKSASEIEARYFGGGDQADNDSKYPNLSRSSINDVTPG